MDSPSLVSEATFSTASTTADSITGEAALNMLEHEKETFKDGVIESNHKKPELSSPVQSSQDPEEFVTGSQEGESTPEKLKCGVSAEDDREEAPVILDDTDTMAVGDTATAQGDLTLQGHEPAEPETQIDVVNKEQQQQQLQQQPKDGTTDVSQSKPQCEAAPVDGNTSVLSSWDIASEHVATVALQCLSKDKDMELSYVSILSAMTVLQSKQDEPPEINDPIEPISQELQDARQNMAKAYSQIITIMCRTNVAESLGKETLRQGVMSPEALYTQFYGSVQQAGYDLEVNQLL
jgi:hypothetical protein